MRNTEIICWAANVVTVQSVKAGKWSRLEKVSLFGSHAGLVMKILIVLMCMCPAFLISMQIQIVIEFVDTWQGVNILPFSWKNL